MFFSSYYIFSLYIEALWSLVIKSTFAARKKIKFDAALDYKFGCFVEHVNQSLSLTFFSFLLFVVFLFNHFPSPSASLQDSNPLSQGCESNVLPRCYNGTIIKHGLKIAGNPKGGSITVQLTSCLTVLESAVWLLTIFIFIHKQTHPNQSNRRSMVQWYFPF